MSTLVSTCAVVFAAIVKMIIEMVMNLLSCVQPGFTVNITAAWAVDREFVHIVGPAGAPFGRLGPPLGFHWDAFGPTLVSLWLSWDTFGVHVQRLQPQGAIWESH